MCNDVPTMRSRGWALLALRRVGLVSALALPAHLPHRPELRPMPGAQSMNLSTLLARRVRER